MMPFDILMTSFMISSFLPLMGFPPQYFVCGWKETGFSVCFWYQQGVWILAHCSHFLLQERSLSLIVQSHAVLPCVGAGGTGKIFITISTASKLIFFSILILKSPLRKAGLLQFSLLSLCICPGQHSPAIFQPWQKELEQVGCSCGSTAHTEDSLPMGCTRGKSPPGSLDK